MRRLREAAGARQETIATAAVFWRLSWTQATVASIELGQRGLSVGEFIILPLVFEEAGLRRRSGEPFQLEDFVPVSITPPAGSLALAGQAPARSIPNAPVVPGGFQMPLRIVRTLLRGGHPPSIVMGKRAEAGPGEAERKAARKVGCSPAAILKAARELWGRTLSEERDRRIGERARALDRRTLQAVRGRVTRTLVKELAPHIKRRR